MMPYVILVAIFAGIVFMEIMESLNCALKWSLNMMTALDIAMNSDAAYMNLNRLIFEKRWGRLKGASNFGTR